MAVDCNQSARALRKAAKGLSVAAVVLITTAISLAQVGSRNARAGSKEFSIPTPNSFPGGITAGPDGNMWFTETLGGKIGRITPAGKITEFPLPPGSKPQKIAAGRDATLWFTDGQNNKIGQINPLNGNVVEFLVPTPNSSPFGITAGPDGNVWFTEPGSDKIGRITPKGAIQEFTGSFAGEGITAGPDGNVWFTEVFGIDNIGRITPAGLITEFPVPTRFGEELEITAGPDGNLWFTEALGNKIASIDPFSGLVSEFSLPTTSFPIGITAGVDGALWFTEEDTGKIGRIFPDGTFEEFSIHTANSAPTSITAGPDGNVWFTEDRVNKIGEGVLPNPAMANRAQQAPPIQLGTSGSNVNDVSGGGSCCVSGTLGALVKDAAGKTYILSNNHVLARVNQASQGEAIIQRGYLDTSPECSGDGANEVAHLSQFVPLDFLFVNDVDAAIAETVPGQVDLSGAILGIGPVSTVTAAPALGMPVLKAGRTTGKTSGSIDVIHLTVTVRVGFGCDRGTRLLKFRDQFAVLPSSSGFAEHGDSGSLIVKPVVSGSPNPVGLLFAAAPDGTTLGNPIDTVLKALGVTMVGAAPITLDRASAAVWASDPHVEAAARIKQRYDQFLLGLPEVVGHGVGYSQSGSRRVVIRLLLKKITNAARRAAPLALEGVPVELQETGEFSTIPMCGKRLDANRRP